MCECAFACLRAEMPRAAKNREFMGLTDHRRSLSPGFEAEAVYQRWSPGDSTSEFFLFFFLFLLPPSLAFNHPRPLRFLSLCPPLIMVTLPFAGHKQTRCNFCPLERMLSLCQNHGKHPRAYCAQADIRGTSPRGRWRSNHARYNIHRARHRSAEL